MPCEHYPRDYSRWRRKGCTTNCWLRRKNITFPTSSDAREVYHDLLYHFPKLSEAGGFELLRVPEGGGKQLKCIASPQAGYTVS